MPPDGPTSTRLPPGFTVALDHRTRVLDGGAVLVGGAPPRLVRLTAVARRLLVDGAVTVADATSAALARRLVDGGLAHPVAVPDPPPAGDVTVVVPVKDRVDPLRRMLAALRDRTPGLGALVVVDDGSGDPAAIAATVHHAGGRVLRHHRAQGPSAARNAGLAAATTPLVAFLDSDVVPQPGWLEPLLAAFADPAVGLAAPRIVALDPVRGLLGRYEAVRSSLDLGVEPAPVVPRSRVAYVPSAALLVRRAAAGAGFDVSLHVAEDVDLVLRLHAAGWRLRYDPAARVAHEHRTTLRAWWLRKAYYGTGAAPLALRHRGAVPPLVLSPWSAAVGALALTGSPRAAVAAVGVSVLAAERLSHRLSGVARPRAVAARLIARGLGGALAQAADGLTRHYWPVTVAACVGSRRARRVALTVGVAEGLLDWARHRDRHPGVRPRPLEHLVARRLDDLAYGAGLWWGAARLRTVEPLRPVGARAGLPSCPAGSPGGHAESKESRMADEKHSQPLPDAAGMPEMHPPEGGPNADPESPDPADLMAPRPGALEGEQDGEPKPN